MSKGSQFRTGVQNHKGQGGCGRKGNELILFTVNKKQLTDSMYIFRF